MRFGLLGFLLLSVTAGISAGVLTNYVSTYGTEHHLPLSIRKVVTALERLPAGTSYSEMLEVTKLPMGEEYHTNTIVANTNYHWVLQPGYVLEVSASHLNGVEKAEIYFCDLDSPTRPCFRWQRSWAE